MAFDEELAERIRSVVKGKRGITEQKMFGGLAFMLKGNMSCGIVDDKLMLRLGAAGAQDALQEKHVQEMDFTRKPIKTMVYVTATGIRTEAKLRTWVQRALDFAKTLPAK
jgi:TfoX/Sxy family transcriptional regulator of competence genes